MRKIATAWGRSMTTMAILAAMPIPAFASPQQYVDSNPNLIFSDPLESVDQAHLVSQSSPTASVESSLVAGPIPNDACSVDDGKKKAAAEKKKKEELKKKVGGAYKDPFYLNDFSYLKNPAYTGYNLGEGLKQLPVGDCGNLDIGGQYRLRYHHEQNMRGLGLTGRDDDFVLDRTRIYADYKMNKSARVFVEFLDAGSTYENFAPRQIEVQRFDAQNLFGDLVLVDSDLGKLTGRVGRQELLFGAQRLLSPLDWANNRRRFDGGRLTWNNEDRTTDFLLVRPENINFTKFDSPNQDQALWGVYNSNKTFENGPIDTYYLGYEDTATNLHVHTLGTLIKGEADGLLWDNEFGYQFGRNPDGSDISAYSLTLGIGAKSTGSMKPTIWMYYDWASGDDSVNNGWNHLFPLGHRYNGFMDLFGRRNLHDINTLMTFNPSEKFTVLAWYHYFFLENGNQGPYNITLSPFNPGGTVGHRDLGHEIDLLGTYKLSARSDLVLGYSHFFAGKYYDSSLRANGSALFNGDADFLYSQWHYNF
ncbi:MAG: alginate export family protein [Pirellula sp.]